MADDDAELTDSFELLAHPTRMGVLRELFESFRTTPERPALGFADLRKRVEAPDSGNFSYHLDRLVGWYLDECEDGYRLTSRGIRVALTLGSGAYGEPDVSVPEGSFGDCPICGAAFDASFEAGIFALQCPDGHQMNLHLRPEAFETRTEAELSTLAGMRILHDAQQALEEICPACDSRLDLDWRDLDEMGGYLLSGRCLGCGFQYGLPAGICVVCDLEVAAFLAERGVDPRRTPVWEFAFCRPGAETVASTDPLRLRVDVEADGERLSATVDESGSVVRTSRYR
jgi:hypothetical protein